MGAVAEVPGHHRGAVPCAGAPADLVQIVTGYGKAGSALVTGGVDKLIFVGSTKVPPPSPNLPPSSRHIASSWSRPPLHAALLN